MLLYPVFINLVGAKVLVVGTGAVGLRKLTALVNAGAGDILVLDIAPPVPELTSFIVLPNVSFMQRGVEVADIEGRILVFAATGDAVENARIAALCATRGVLCNVVTDPELGTFHVPAIARKGGITAAFSTGGQSPALARCVREEAETWLDERFGVLAVFMGRLRPLILGLGNDSADNSILFRKLISSSLATALCVRDRTIVREIVRTHLPVTLHSHIEDLLDGLC